MEWHEGCFDMARLLLLYVTWSPNLTDGILLVLAAIDHEFLGYPALKNALGFNGDAPVPFCRYFIAIINFCV